MVFFAKCLGKIFRKRQDESPRKFPLDQELRIKAKLTMPVVPMPTAELAPALLGAGMCKRMKTRPTVMLTLTRDYVSLGLPNGKVGQNIQFLYTCVESVDVAEKKSGVAITYERIDGTYSSICLKLKHIKPNSCFSRKTKITGKEVQQAVQSRQIRQAIEGPPEFPYMTESGHVEYRPSLAEFVLPPYSGRTTPEARNPFYSDEELHPPINAVEIYTDDGGESLFDSQEVCDEDPPQRVQLGKRSRNPRQEKVPLSSSSDILIRECFKHLENDMTDECSAAVPSNQLSYVSDHELHLEVLVSESQSDTYELIEAFTSQATCTDEPLSLMPSSQDTCSTHTEELYALSSLSNASSQYSESEELLASVSSSLDTCSSHTEELVTLSSSSITRVSSLDNFSDSESFLSSFSISGDTCSTSDHSQVLFALSSPLTASFHSICEEFIDSLPSSQVISFSETEDSVTISEDTCSAQIEEPILCSLDTSSAQTEDSVTISEDTCSAQIEEPILCSLDTSSAQTEKPLPCSQGTSNDLTEEPLVSTPCSQDTCSTLTEEPLPSSRDTCSDQTEEPLPCSQDTSSAQTEEPLPCSQDTCNTLTEEPLPSSQDTCGDLTEEPLSSSLDTCSDQTEEPVPCSQDTCGDLTEEPLPSSQETCSDQIEEPLPSSQETCGDQTEEPLPSSQETCGDQTEEPLPCSQDTCSAQTEEPHVSTPSSQDTCNTLTEELRSSSKDTCNAEEPFATTTSSQHSCSAQTEEPLTVIASLQVEHNTTEEALSSSVESSPHHVGDQRIYTVQEVELMMFQDSNFEESPSPNVVDPEPIPPEGDQLDSGKWEGVTNMLKEALGIAISPKHGQPNLQETPLSEQPPSDGQSTSSSTQLNAQLPLASHQANNANCSNGQLPSAFHQAKYAPLVSTPSSQDTCSTLTEESLVSVPSSQDTCCDEKPFVTTTSSQHSCSAQTEEPLTVIASLKDTLNEHSTTEEALSSSVESSPHQIGDQRIYTVQEVESIMFQDSNIEESPSPNVVDPEPIPPEDDQLDSGKWEGVTNMLKQALGIAISPNNGQPNLQETAHSEQPPSDGQSTSSATQLNTQMPLASHQANEAQCSNGHLPLTLQQANHLLPDSQQAECAQGSNMCHMPTSSASGSYQRTTHSSHPADYIKPSSGYSRYAQLQPSGYYTAAGYAQPSSYYVAGGYAQPSGYLMAAGCKQPSGHSRARYVQVSGCTYFIPEYSQASSYSTTGYAQPSGLSTTYGYEHPSRYTRASGYTYSTAGYPQPSATNAAGYYYPGSRANVDGSIGSTQGLWWSVGRDGTKYLHTLQAQPTGEYAVVSAPVQDPGSRLR